MELMRIRIRRMRISSSKSVECECRFGQILIFKWSNGGFTPEQAVLPLVDFGTLARTNRGLFKKNQEPAASRCQKLIVFDLFTFFTKVRYSIRQRRNFIKSAFEEDGPKKFDEFECAKNRRSSNVVEFECELRHIPTI